SKSGGGSPARLGLRPSRRKGQLESAAVPPVHARSSRVSRCTRRPLDVFGATRQRSESIPPHGADCNKGVTHAADLVRVSHRPSASTSLHAPIASDGGERLD